MKNFMFGVLAMLVLFAGGFAVWSMVGEEDSAGPTASGGLFGGNSDDGSPVRTSIFSPERGEAESETNVTEQDSGAEDAAETGSSDNADPAPTATPLPRPTGRPTSIARPTATATVSPGAIVARGACNDGPFVVFFDWDSASITPDAAVVLNNAASAYRACGNARISIAGHTDRANASQYAVGLSQRMADNVARYLQGRGLPASRMSTEAFGESQPRIPTADGVRELQNRRVEVRFGG